MKKILTTTLIAAACAATAMAKDLNVLMIGNSFSVCLGRYLPSIVHNAPGHTLSLTSAYIGGCPLDRHWSNIQATEKDPGQKQYSVKTWNSANPAKVDDSQDSINALIKKGGWDIITIQQASPKSWDYKTYQPFAGNLIAYIREHAPSAEIVIQQTWSYRATDNRINPENEKGWGFDQAGMFQRVRDAYAQLAAATKLRVIPVGQAVQNARAAAPQVPQKDKEPLTGTDADVVGAGGDNIHLNRRGEYLQACTWFASLFGDNATTIKFIPKDFDPGYAQTLQTCAQQAVTGKDSEK